MNPRVIPSFFAEHPHVYTLGKSGDERNMLLNYIQLQAKDAAFVKSNREEDITYHGPGQVVGYPIFDLVNFNLGLKQYIHKIREAIINTLAYMLSPPRDLKAQRAFGSMWACPLVGKYVPLVYEVPAL